MPPPPTSKTNRWGRPEPSTPTPQVDLAGKKSNSFLSFVPELTGQQSFERLREADFPLDEIVYSLGQSNYLDMVLYVFARRLFEVDYTFFADL